MVWLPSSHCSPPLDRAVATARRDGRINAPKGGVAGIIGTDIAVDACQRARMRAGPARAYVTRGACVVVGTGQSVVAVPTARRRLAGISSTYVAVVTGGRRARLANTGSAVVPIGAGVSIVTRPHVVREHTPQIGVTRICGADVAVVTGQHTASAADAAAADVIGRTKVTVVARSLVVLMHAAAVLVAGIAGADIAVVAVGGTAALTDASVTNVSNRAGVAVITRVGVGGKDTTIDRVT